MKKLKKLNLKKIKIANVNVLYTIRGGETETCMSAVCNTDICDTTGATYTVEPTACTSVGDPGACTSTGHTTTHTMANSVGCMSGDNNNGGGPRQTIEIC
jgi:hypothetical protein